MPPSIGTPRRTFRIEDDLYFPALLKAEREGRTLADVIRELLEGYVNSP